MPKTQGRGFPWGRRQERERNGQLGGGGGGGIRPDGGSKNNAVVKLAGVVDLIGGVTWLEGSGRPE